jgi:TolA-binding protein
MKRYLVIAVFAAAAATSIAFVTRSQAAVSEPSADPQIAALTRQTKALQVQVKTLQRQMKTLQGRVVDDEGQLSVNFEGDTCLGAQVADVIQGTWVTIDQLSAATQAGKTYFGSQTPVSDYNNCADLARPAVPRPGITVPPTINPLRPLLEWLHVPLG